MKRAIPHKNSGFTLIELIVTLAIAGILYFYALPSYSQFGMRQKISNQANDLLSDLMFARVSAIKEGQSVAVTSLDGTNWSTGWNISLVSSAQNIRSKQTTNQNLAITGDVGVITFNNLGNALTTANVIVSHADVTGNVILTVSLSGLITTRD